MSNSAMSALVDLASLETSLQAFLQRVEEFDDQPVLDEIALRLFDAMRKIPVRLQYYEAVTNRRAYAQRIHTKGPGQLNFDTQGASELTLQSLIAFTKTLHDLTDSDVRFAEGVHPATKAIREALEDAGLLAGEQLHTLRAA